MRDPVNGISIGYRAFPASRSSRLSVEHHPYFTEGGSELQCGWGWRLARWSSRCRRRLTAVSDRRRHALTTTLTKRARAIHERVMTLDTHNDIEPGELHGRAQLHPGPRQSGQPAEDVRGRPRCLLLHRLCRSGTATPEGYDDAYKQAIAKFDAIHRLTEQIAPDKIGLALTAADARRIYASGRKVAFIGVENGYPLGEDLGASRSSTIAAPAICRWPTTATASSPTRTPASATAGSGTACRRSAARRSPR